MTAEAEYEIPVSELLSAPPPAESPFSLNWRMVDGAGCEVQVTMRAGVNRQVMTEVMRERKQFLEAAQLAGWTFTAASKPAPVAAPSNGTVDFKQAVEAARNGQWQPPAPTGPVAANVAGGSFASKPRESFVAVKMDVVLRPDGKLNVNFYAAGHQYPDMYVTKTPAEMVAALAKTGPWTVAEHFSKPGIFEGLNLLVEYTLSDKKNSKGNSYKDLADIRPA
jgi:hypothetical protein